MKEFFFKKCGIAYRTNEFQAERLTLVFIHGLSGSASAWFPYEPLFEKRYNLLTFDLRGHGKSSKPRSYEEYELEKSADDLHELLAYLHIESFVLISHSYGTLVALEFLQAHQEKVSATIFLSPTAFLRKTKRFPLIRTLGRGLVALFDMFPLHPTIRERVDYSPYIPAGDWDLRRVPRDIYATSVRVYLYCLVQAYLWNCDEMWKRIGIPTLIMHGTTDSYIPVSHSVQLSKDIVGSKLVLLEHANHIIVLNNVAEVSRHIEAFLA